MSRLFPLDIKNLKMVVLIRTIMKIWTSSQVCWQLGVWPKDQVSFVTLLLKYDWLSAILNLCWTNISQCFCRDYWVTLKSHGTQTRSSLVEIVWLVIVGQGKINGGLCYNKCPTPSQKSYTPVSMLTCTLNTRHIEGQRQETVLTASIFFNTKTEQKFVYNFSFFCFTFTRSTPSNGPSMFTSSH